MRSKIIVIVLIIFLSNTIFAQSDQSTILLDIKKSRATYEIAKQKLEKDQKLYFEKAIAENEYIRSKNQLLSAEVEYQKLILKLITQQSQIMVEEAVKYQSEKGEKRVRVVLKSTVDGSQEILEEFGSDLAASVFKVRSDRIYNVFVSILNIPDQIIIGSPYERHISKIDSGINAIVDFGLLQDVENLQVKLNYNGRIDKKNIYLQKQAVDNYVSINSVQFSQEADLGSNVSFDLVLERFSSSDDVYRLLVLNLPKQVNYEFLDSETNARLSQIKFTQGTNTKKLILKTYLPEIQDIKINIDQAVEFYVLVLSGLQYEKISQDISKQFSADEIMRMDAGYVKLEIIPKGRGEIEVQIPTLYYEVSQGDSVFIEITIKNIGLQRLDNIRISTSSPIFWRANISPSIIKTINPDDESIVGISLIPPREMSIGAQEVKLKVESLVNNMLIDSEEKTIRIKVLDQTPVLTIILLSIIIIGLIIGTVFVGFKIAHR